MKAIKIGLAVACLVVILVALAMTACTTNGQNSELQPAHYDGDGFKNPHLGAIDKSFFKFLKVRFFGDMVWADHASLADTVPVQPFKTFVEGPITDSIEVTWLGHSTFVIRIEDKVILTDPMFSDRASPVSFAGPERYVPHAMDYSVLHTVLPQIDAVVISHNHYDHLDEASIALLGNKTRYLVPLKLGAWFEDVGIDANKITEFDWWQEQTINGIKVQALPSQHWSARGLFDRNKTLWASWAITVNDQTIWFAGDTGYNQFDFNQIGARLAQPINLALIPIGAYEPRDFMGPQHVNPNEAVQIYKDIGAKKAIGMHWGTFPLTAETPIRPVEDLAEALHQKQVSSSDFITMKIGQTIVLKDDNFIDE